MVRAQRQIGEKVETETRYFISSLAVCAKEHFRFIRSHWGIENQLHYVLNVAFREDNHRTRQGHSAANLALIRRIVLNLLRQETSAKGGIHAKRLRCGWDVAFCMKVLQPLLDFSCDCPKLRGHLNQVAPASCFTCSITA